jgi:hypothetical protein
MNKTENPTEIACRKSPHQHFPGGPDCVCIEAPHFHGTSFCERSWSPRFLLTRDVPIGTNTYHLELDYLVADKALLTKFMSMLHGGPAIKLVELGLNIKDVFELYNLFADKESDVAEREYQEEHDLIESAVKHYKSLVEDLLKISRRLRRFPIFAPSRPGSSLPFEDIWPADNEVLAELNRIIGRPLSALVELSKRPRGRQRNFGESAYIFRASELSWKNKEAYHDEHWLVLFNVGFNKQLDLDSYSRERRRIRQEMGRPAEADKKT